MTSPLTQAERLRQAIIDAEISRLELARLMEDEGTPPDRVRNTKRMIVRWLRGGGISDPNAVRIARAFNKREPDRYELTHFLKEPELQPKWADEVAALHEERQRDREAYQAELRRLREELERTRQEVFYEIERMREAS